MKRLLCNLLRSLLHRLEGLESDDELRARCIGVMRANRITGTRETFEQAIADVSPFYMVPTFKWDGPRKLTVEWR